MKGDNPPRGNENSYLSSSAECTSEIVHIKAHTPVLSYYTVKPDSSCHNDDTDTENSDKHAKMVGENQVPTSPTSYSWLVSVNGAAASCGLITELNICDFAHQIASGLQHLQSLNVSKKRCSYIYIVALSATYTGIFVCGLVGLPDLTPVSCWFGLLLHSCREKGRV